MKLAQYQKDQIRAAVVAEKFDPLFAKLEDEKMNLALSIVANAREAIKDAPAEWFATRSSIMCSFDGRCIYLPLGEELPLPNRCHTWLHFAEGSAEYHDFHRIQSLQGELEVRRSELRAEINAVLKAVSTDKKLEEVWPEALRYLNKAPNLPATTDISRLKNLLEQP